MKYDKYNLLYDIIVYMISLVWCEVRYHKLNHNIIVLIMAIIAMIWTLKSYFGLCYHSSYFNYDIIPMLPFPVQFKLISQWRQALIDTLRLESFIKRLRHIQLYCAGNRCYRACRSAKCIVAPFYRKENQKGKPPGPGLCAPTSTSLVLQSPAIVSSLLSSLSR